MSDTNRSGDVTSGSNIVNPPDIGRKGPTTRQQPRLDALAHAAAVAAATRAPAASQGEESTPASIDYPPLRLPCLT